MRVLFRLSEFFCIFCLLALSQLASAFTLIDHATGNHFMVNPETLAASVELTNGKKIIISTELNAAPITALSKSDLTNQWQRDDIKIEASLDGDSLVMRFTRSTPGEINWPEIPSGAKALLLPLFEGSYIPAMDAQWRKVLSERERDMDTTQSLSLPAVGFEYGDSVLSVVYVNPFNNNLHFNVDEQGIGISSKHIFTRLDQTRAYEVRISINEKDLLAPAKRYRTWLQQQGQFVSLKHKLAAAPEGNRLIGASHVYLWGEGLITQRDVKNWKQLQQLTPAAWLNKPDVLTLFQAGDILDNKYAQRVLIQTIHQNLEQQMPGYTAEVFNQRRDWLLHTLGTALNPVETWGDLNPNFIAQLKNAGLEKLWIGLHSWTAGFANPNSIKAARAVGYLIGPYDSYDTALPEKNDNLSWLTAQMGQEAFLKCGVLLENGQRKTGFQNSGVYTNPLCVRPIMEKRVAQLQQQLNFNSWFIDVDATGMLFDDYDPARLTSQAQDVKNRIDSMAWISKNLKIIVGSEDGHAVANSSIAFAHGMQVRGFGWRDKDMRKNESSPFFLGRWFPSNQPELFFKRVSIKPEYQALYFNPACRLPLFQAAFHDSVVTTNHWSLDNLKFKETQQSTELLQQLYNVPPMLNISADTAKERIAYLKHIDSFFRPLHARLYDQALVDFKFLSEDGLLQQTKFADGTAIVGNFGSKTVQWQNKNIEANSLIALLPDGQLIGFNVSSSI